MIRVFPIFGSRPDSNGNAESYPMRYYTRKNYINNFGIDPLTVKAAVSQSKLIRL